MCVPCASLVPRGRVHMVALRISIFHARPSSSSSSPALSASLSSGSDYYRYFYDVSGGPHTDICERLSGDLTTYASAC